VLQRDLRRAAAVARALQLQPRDAVGDMQQLDAATV
jgi:hypothetical protein